VPPQVLPARYVPQVLQPQEHCARQMRHDQRQQGLRGLMTQSTTMMQRHVEQEDSIAFLLHW
jgi:hypothetical protein